MQSPIQVSCREFLKLIVSSGKFIGNSRKLWSTIHIYKRVIGIQHTIIIDKHIMSLFHTVDRDIKEMRE